MKSLKSIWLDFTWQIIARIPLFQRIRNLDGLLCLFSAPAKPDRPTVVETGKHVVNLKYNYGIGGGWTHQFKVLYRKQG